MQNKLEISVEITAEKILRAESSYYETIMNIASAKREVLRNDSFIEKNKKSIKSFVFWLCVAGIALIVLDFIPYGYCKPKYLLDASLFIFFTLVIVFLKKEDALHKSFWAKFNPYISDIKAEATFRLARRLVPFEARYTLQGNSISYARVKGGVSNPNWSREISGEYYICGDYVITYKNKQLYPHLFIFVGSSNELATYFEVLGIKKIEI